MSQRSESLATLGVSVFVLVFVVLFGIVCYGWENDDCEARCLDQFGPEYTIRVTRTEYSTICDCIGPEGDVKAPQ